MKQLKKWSIIDADGLLGKLTCCEKMHNLYQALSEAVSDALSLIPDMLPLICDYALGHDLVKPRSEHGKLRIHSFCDTFHHCAITFEALREYLAKQDVKNFKISEWKWHNVKNEKCNAIIYKGQEPGDMVKDKVLTLGTVLLLQAYSKTVWRDMGRWMNSDRTMCIIGITAEDEVEIALFLMKYGNPAVRKSICPVYVDAIRYLNS